MLQHSCSRTAWIINQTNLDQFSPTDRSIRRPCHDRTYVGEYIQGDAAPGCHGKIRIIEPYHCSKAHPLSLRHRTSRIDVQENTFPDYEPEMCQCEQIAAWPEHNL